MLAKKNWMEAEVRDIMITLKSSASHYKFGLAAFLFLAPALTFFSIYVIIPIFQSLQLSLFEWNGLYNSDGVSTATFVGLDNYRKLWVDPNFWISLKNNFLWLLLYLLAVPLGLMVALFLNQTVMGIRVYKSLFFFPFVISQVVVGFIFGWFYNPDFGIVAKLWQFIFCEETINFIGNKTFKCARSVPDILSSADYATYGIIFAGLWPQVAYCVILYLTGLNNVAADQVEAGRLDGAKGWRMLWFIILPQLKPATFIAIAVTIIGALRSFDMIAVMTQGGPYGMTNVLSHYMYEVALSEYGDRYGYGSAVATILFGIMMVFITYFLWSMYQDERRDS